jgi:histidine triad (HIT) family protein
MIHPKPKWCMGSIYRTRYMLFLQAGSDTYRAPLKNHIVIHDTIFNPKLVMYNSSREAAMKDCIFCKIGASEMEGEVVYEDGEVVVIKDIHPQAPVHVLIIPKKHIGGLTALGPKDEALVGKMVTLSKMLADRFSVSQCGFRLVVNSGPDAGQAVDHLHFHFLGGRKFGWPPG